MMQPAVVDTTVTREEAMVETDAALDWSLLAHLRAHEREMLPVCAETAHDDFEPYDAERHPVRSSAPAGVRARVQGSDAAHCSCVATTSARNEALRCASFDARRRLFPQCAALCAARRERCRAVFLLCTHSRRHRARAEPQPLLG